MLLKHSITRKWKSTNILTVFVVMQIITTQLKKVNKKGVLLYKLSRQSKGKEELFRRLKRSEICKNAD